MSEQWPIFFNSFLSFLPFSACRRSAALVKIFDYHTCIAKVQSRFPSCGIALASQSDLFGSCTRVLLCCIGVEWIVVKRFPLLFLCLVSDWLSRLHGRRVSWRCRSQNSHNGIHQRCAEIRTRTGRGFSRKDKIRDHLQYFSTVIGTNPNPITLP